MLDDSTRVSTLPRDAGGANDCSVASQAPWPTATLELTSRLNAIDSTQAAENYGGVLARDSISYLFWLK
jgi:hypothetical protein